MGNSSARDWSNTECWESNGLSYSEETGALTFTGTEFLKTAVYKIEIPSDAKSFSFSIKSGSGRENGDTGYITIGFDDGENAMGFKSNGIFSTSYVITSLGNSAEPINITGKFKDLYVMVEARNAGEDNVDFCFKDLKVDFYNQKGKTDFFGNLTSETFIQTTTDEKVISPDNSPRILIFGLIIAALAGGVIAYKKLKDKMYSL